MELGSLEPILLKEEEELDIYYSQKLNYNVILSVLLIFFLDRRHAVIYTIGFELVKALSDYII
jgi:hypothetical protein